MDNNNKAQGWNIIGRSFWNIGHVYIRENEKALYGFLEGIYKDKKTCIIGASGVDLIKAALKHQLNFSVIDFSRTMCEDLAKEIHPQQCQMFLHDMILDSTETFKQHFYYFLTDQVINCFAKQSVPVFFRNISQMLQPEGELRTIIKIGFYDLDQLLINRGKEIGTLDKFYNKQNNTIDYSKAEQELTDVVVPHPQVPKEVLVQWYMGRGEESRFELDEINAELINQHIDNGEFKIVEVRPIVSLTQATYFRFQWLPD